MQARKQILFVKLSAPSALVQSCTLSMSVLTFSVLVFTQTLCTPHIPHHSILSPCTNLTSSVITKNGPYAWGNFHACAITKISKTTTAGPGARMACSSIITCAAVSRASPCTISAGCCMQAAAETTASRSTGKEDLKADRRVRHYKEVGLPEWPLAGRATVPRGLYGIGLCMSLRRRTILSKSLRAPAPVDLTIHTFRTVDRTAGRRFAVVARFGKR